MSEVNFSPIEEALEELKAGRMIIVCILDFKVCCIVFHCNGNVLKSVINTYSVIPLPL